MLHWNPIFAILVAGWFGTFSTLPDHSLTVYPADTIHITKIDDSELPPIRTILPDATQKKDIASCIPEEPIPTATPIQTTPPVATEISTTTAITTTFATESTKSDETTTISADAVKEESSIETEPVSDAAQEILDTQETWFKAYMDYRTITDTSSEQYALQQQAWTDSFGLRRIGDDYLVAMGTGWLDEGCGERFMVTLETGASFTVMIGDIKADRHTDASSLYRWCENGANVLEFIVDTDILSSDVKTAGTISAYDTFAGNIEEIARL